MTRQLVSLLVITMVALLCCVGRAASHYPRETSVSGSVIQLLVAANGGKPALVVRCEGECPSEVVLLVDHPDAERIHIGHHVDVIATFDSTLAYHGVGGSEVRATIYKVRAKRKGDGHQKT